MNPTENVLCPEYRKHQITDLMDVAPLLDSKRCYTVEMERRLGNPDDETGLVEACGACKNCGRNKLHPTISIDSTMDMIFYLFITGDHTIDG